MYYPTTDDLLSSMGLSRARPVSSVPDWVTPAAVFATGVFAGAAGALLFAPKPGREFREDIRNAASNVGGTVRELGGTVRESLPALPHVSNPFSSASNSQAIEAK